MKKMKKIGALLLVASVLFCFVSCDAASVVDFVVDNFLSVDVEPGYIEGDTYINNELGFSFNKPGHWRYCSDEEIAESMSEGVEEIFGEYSELILALVNPSSYDMMVVDDSTGCNIIVGYEDLNRTFSTNMTEEEYLRNTEANMANLGAGMTVTFPESFDAVTLGNTGFTRAVCNSRVDGYNLTQVYYAHKGDGYMGFVIVTISSGYSVSEIESMFH